MFPSKRNLIGGALFHPTSRSPQADQPYDVSTPILPHIIKQHQIRSIGSPRTGDRGSKYSNWVTGGYLSFWMEQAENSPVSSFHTTDMQPCAGQTASGKLLLAPRLHGCTAVGRFTPCDSNLMQSPCKLHANIAPAISDHCPNCP